MGNLLHEALSEQIIGAAMAVLNELKPGLDEKLYEKALVIELRNRGHVVDQQKQFKIAMETHRPVNPAPRGTNKTIRAIRTIRG